MKRVDTSKFEYKDMFGREIKPGDYIVYAGLADRSAVLRAGQVIELTHSKPQWDGQEVVPKIKVKSWNNFRAQGYSDEGDRSGRQKDVTLEFFDRIVVVDKSQVSDKIISDLDGPICDYFGKPI